MLSLNDGKTLVKLARDSINSILKRKEIEVNEGIKLKYSEKLGVFVTIKKQGALRGCIGFPNPTQELWKGVMDGARAAAFEDPRFSPLKENEEVDLELSVLTKPELIKGESQDYFEEIKIGKDGLIIRAGMYSGLLLPIVALEYNWTVEEFLRQVCVKAGLAMDAWKTNDIYKFQTQVFSEENKQIVEKM